MSLPLKEIARSGLLLRDVSQFVRKQSSTGVGVERVLTGSEHHLVAGRKSAGAHRGRSAVGGGVGVDAHFAEVDTETWLEKGARGLIKRFTATN